MLSGYVHHIEKHTLFSSYLRREPPPGWFTLLISFHPFDLHGGMGIIRRHEMFLFIPAAVHAAADDHVHRIMKTRVAEFRHLHIIKIISNRLRRPKQPVGMKVTA